MLVRLFNAPSSYDFIETNTIGSSKVIMLEILAHKWTLRESKKN